MKPIYTVLIKHGDREHVMAFPFTYRRLSRALAALGYSFEPSTEDDDAYIEEYRSRVGAVPDKDMELGFVNDTALFLEQLTPAQVKAMRLLNDAFSLTFWDTKDFITFIAGAKGVTAEYIAQNGVPYGLAAAHEDGGE